MGYLLAGPLSIRRRASNASSAAPLARKKTAAIQVSLVMRAVVGKNQPSAWALLHPYRTLSVTTTRISFTTSLALYADALLRVIVSATPATRIEAERLNTIASIRIMAGG